MHVIETNCELCGIRIGYNTEKERVKDTIVEVSYFGIFRLCPSCFTASKEYLLGELKKNVRVPKQKEVR